MSSPDGRWWWDGEAWRLAGPLPPRSRSKKSTIAVSLAVLFVIIAVGAVGAVLGMFLLFATTYGAAHDHRSLDDDKIIEAARAGCGAVSQSFDNAGPDRLTRIAVGNTALARLVETMEKTGKKRLEGDPPATEWVEDWNRLADARANFAQQLSVDPTAVFAIPQTNDGYIITQRMMRVAPLECERAVELSSQP